MVQGEVWGAALLVAAGRDPIQLIDRAVVVAAAQSGLCIHFSPFNIAKKFCHKFLLLHLGARYLAALLGHSSSVPRRRMASAMYF